MNTNKDAKALSRRELTVFALLVQGKTQKDIANALGIATRTAESHMRGIYKKTCMNRVQLISNVAQDIREKAAAFDWLSQQIRVTVDCSIGDEFCTFVSVPGAMYSLLQCIQNVSNCGRALASAGGQTKSV